MARPVHLHVMLAPEEMASLRSLSDAIDLTVSDTVRVLIQAGESGGPVGLAFLMFDHETLVRNVRSLGHLLNQSTHALNTIAKIVRESGVDALDLTEALEGVSRELES